MAVRLTNLVLYLWMLLLYYCEHKRKHMKDLEQFIYDRKDTNCHFRLNGQLLWELKKYCLKNDIRMSVLIRYLIENFLEKKKKNGKQSRINHRTQFLKGHELDLTATYNGRGKRIFKNE